MRWIRGIGSSSPMSAGLAGRPSWRPHRTSSASTSAFLLRLNNQWQAVMAGCEGLEAKPLLPQQDFFDWRVKPFL